MWSRQKRLLREQRGQWGLIRICNPKYWKRISGARVEPAPLSVCASHCPRSDDEPRHAFLEKIDLEAVLLEKPAYRAHGLLSRHGRRLPAHIRVAQSIVEATRNVVRASRLELQDVRSKKRDILDAEKQNLAPSPGKHRGGIVYAGNRHFRKPAYNGSDVESQATPKVHVPNVRKERTDRFREHVQII